MSRRPTNLLIGSHSGLAQRRERYLNLMRLRFGRGAVCGAATAAVFVYAWWATGQRPFTAGATLAVIGAGLAAMAVGHAGRPQNESPPAFAGVSGWLVLLVLLGGWQALAFVQEPRSQHPTLSSITNAALDNHSSRAIAFAAWLVGAYALARR